MRLLKSTPQNRDFHSEHGRNLRPYYLIANLGQLLSAASLSLALFSILSDAIAGKGMSVGTGFVVVAAVVVAIFIELANRTLARPAIKPAVVKDQFSEDEDANRIHRIITRWSRAGLLVVGGLSFVLSYMGSVDASELMSTPPPPAPVDSLNIAAVTATDAVHASFAADTAVLLAPYAIRQRAALQQFNAIKAERTKATKQFTGCAAKGNKWCKGKVNGILGEIDAAEATYNATIASIAVERGNTLAEVIKRRSDALNAVSQKSDTEIVTARTKADIEASEAKAETASTSVIFAVLTFIGQLVFYLMFYLILQIEAGSKITEDLEPNEFHSLPSVWTDFKSALSHRTERGARRFMAYLFGERGRLDKPLPYVSLYPDKAVDETDAASVMNAEGIAPELKVTDPIATNHAPGFYRSADDPHGTNKDVSFTAHEPSTNQAPKDTNVSDLKQRLKMYKKRLGEHTQKAKVQQRKTGEISSRTANAITNNQSKVEHYINLLQQQSK